MSSAAKKLLQIQASAGEAVYVDDVFSTYLYEGNGSSGQYINNGIDLGAYPFIKVASSDGNSVSGSETFRVNVKANTKLVVFILDSDNALPTCTVDGSSLTAATSSSNSGGGYHDSAVFIETLTAGFHTIVTSDTALGHTEVMLFDPNATVSVHTNLGVTTSSATSVTTSSVTTDGFCVFLGSDRDTGANFSCNQTSTEYYEKTHTYFNFGAIGINGSSGTVPASVISGMVGTYPTNWCLLKVEGVGNDPTANSAASGEGGLVWTKARENTSGGATIHALIDSELGTNKWLATDTRAVTTNANLITAFDSNGYTVGSGGPYWTNDNGYDYVSWTFRKQPGFFDVVSHTGDGNQSTGISHNLGSVPGMMIIKRTNTTGDWAVYHREVASNPVGYKMKLNDSSARYYAGSSYFPTVPTSTVFYPGSDSDVNGSGNTYVAYLFAHDAQDFGEDGDEAIIKCGSYSGNSGSQTIDVGFEAQWVLIKNTTSASTDWFMVDMMRGIPDTPAIDAALIRANASDAEQTSGAGGARIAAKTTGFGFLTESNLSCNTSGETYVYVAIRRPHKPASEFAATDLFTTVTGRSDSVSPAYETGFVTDMGIQRRPATTEGNYIYTRKAGDKYSLTNDNSTSFNNTGSSIAWDYVNGVMDYFSSAAYRTWNWKRAPGFFDVVTWEGTGVAKTIPHNLGVAPEMIWVFTRTSGERHVVYNKESGNQKWLDLTYTYSGNSDTAGAYWNSTDPTASVFSVGTNYRVNDSSNSYGLYYGFLFASVNGIAKIGSYTGTGSSDIDINCGFSNGARFVLIKCIGGNAAGSHWYLFDSERGIATGNDPYITLDTTSTSAYGAQDAIDPLSSGFKVRSTAVDGINASGGTYLFYAIA